MPDGHALAAADDADFTANPANETAASKPDIVTALQAVTPLAAKRLIRNAFPEGSDPSGPAEMSSTI